MFGFGKSESLVGLDIGSSAVKAVELKAVGKGYRSSAFGSEPVPPDSIVDGAIIDGGAVADAIRRLFDRQQFKTKDVAASLSGNAVIVKKITLPVMTEAELAESIYWEAEQYIPFDIQDVNLDYQILDAGAAAPARARWTCCSWRPRRKRSPTTPASSRRPGASPVVVDVDAFALQNAYEVNYGIEPNAVIVLLNAGASAMNINILSGDQSVFTRDISIGGNAYTEALQKELNLPFESAEPLKKGMPVDGATLRGGPAGAARDDRERAARDSEDVRLLQGDGLLRSHRPHHAERRRLARRRVRRALDGALRGAGRDVRSVQGDRLRPAEIRVDDLDDVAPTVAVAVGLALRRAGDR